MAGLITASAIAKFTNQKFSILVIERNPKVDAGKKTVSGWICGDAVSKRSIDFMRTEIGLAYGRPELEQPVKGVVAYSPDHEAPILFDGEGYVLNRKILPQRQVSDAEKLGVEFEFETTAESLLSENGRIVGISGTDRKTGTKVKKTSKIVVDATGSASKLRQNLPIKSKIQREIDKENDLESTGRYILEFDNARDDTTYFDPDYCIIHLDQDLAPGGYAWVFPKGKNKVNIGLGVQHKSLLRRNRRLSSNDTLQSLIDKYVDGNPAMKNRRLADGDGDSGNSKGNWQVPVRRQNDCMVADGYLLVGDSAWMPRPIDAGGIGPTIVAAVLAGRNIAVALEAEDASEEMLWTYNTDYVRAYGYQMASFELLRRYLQTLSNEKISYGMKHFLSNDDVQNITRREHPNFGRVNLLNPIMWLRIFTHWDLAVGLRYTAQMSEALIEHNLNYPRNPEHFADWHRKLLRMMNEAYQRFT